MKTTDQYSRFIEEFGDLDKDAAFLDAWSPIHDADKIVAPLLSMPARTTQACVPSQTQSSRPCGRVAFPSSIWLRRTKDIR
jgi:hypothetical protein